MTKDKGINWYQPVIGGTILFARSWGRTRRICDNCGVEREGDDKGIAQPVTATFYALRVVVWGDDSNGPSFNTKESTFTLCPVCLEDTGRLTTFLAKAGFRVQ